MTVNSNSAREPSLMLKVAFGLAEQGSKATVQGVQLSAAAIMVRHADMVDSGATVPSIAALGSNGQARTAYLSELVKSQCTTPLPSRKGADVVQFNVLYKKHMAQRTALQRGLDFAASLVAANIGVDCFDDAKRMFRVPASALLEPGDVASETTITNNKLVILDGARHGVVRGKSLATVAASVAQVNRVVYMTTHDGKKPASKNANADVASSPGLPSTGASDTTTTGTASATEIKADPSTWSYQGLLTSASDLLLRAYDIAKEGEAVAWSELDEKTRNALEGLLTFRDECKAIDAVKLSKAA